VDQIVEAPPRENGMVRARDAARHLPWGSITAVLAFLLMSAAAIGFYWTGVDPDEPAGGLSDQLRSNFANLWWLLSSPQYHRIHQASHHPATVASPLPSSFGNVARYAPSFVHSEDVSCIGIGFCLVRKRKREIGRRHQPL
jgi:hypothetical protein